MDVAILDQFGNPMMDGGYDGASRTSQATAFWNAPAQSADQAVNLAKQESDARAQDSVRNDAYVQHGAEFHRDSIVGSHFLLNAQPKSKVLGFDDKWEEEYQEEVETKFTLYAESLDNWIDASRNTTLTGLIRLGVVGFTIYGEHLATAEWFTDKRRPYSTAIQMIDPDRLSNPNHGPDEPRLRRGIEKDRFGAPIACHIRSQHPGDIHLRGGAKYEWRRIRVRKPWGRMQVLHHYEAMRPEQSRGIAEMVAALKEMRMTRNFRDVVLQNAVLQASYAATIESELPPEAAFAQLGMGTAEEKAGATNSWATNYLAALSAWSGKSNNMHVDGAKFTHLYPGSKLKVQPVADQGGIGDNFEQSLLRYLANAFRMSYEEFTGDFTQTNYSSFRAASQNTEKHMKSRKKMCADRLASQIYRLWLEEAIMTGKIDSLPRGFKFHEGQNADAISHCDWIGASRGQTDELKETQAAVLRVRNNLGTEAKELSRLGLDWREVKKQRAREKRMDEELGLNTANDQMMGSVENAAERDTEKNT